MKNIIKTFKLMDVGNSGVGPYQSKYEKEAEELEQKDEIRINIGDKKLHHSLDRTVGYNDLLDASEIKKGINKFLNFNLNDQEVDALMKWSILFSIDQCLHDVHSEELLEPSTLGIRGVA